MACFLKLDKEEIPNRNVWKSHTSKIGEIPVLGCNPNLEQGGVGLQVYVPLVIQRNVPLDLWWWMTIITWMVALVHVRHDFRQNDRPSCCCNTRAPTTFKAFTPLTALLRFLRKHFQGNGFGQKRSSSIMYKWVECFNRSVPCIQTCSKISCCSEFLQRKCFRIDSVQLGDQHYPPARYNRVLGMDWREDITKTCCIKSNYWIYHIDVYIYTHIRQTS